MLAAIDQPNYIPWKGYFDMIHDVDLFVFYNDVQYTVRDWRSRNKIITPNGEQWLSVPAGSNRKRLICEVVLPDKSWQRKHFETIRFAYSKAPFYKKYIDFFAHVYIEKEWEYLFELDQYLIEHIARDFLGIKTKFADSRNYPKTGAKHEKLLSLISVLGGGTNIYLGRLPKTISLSKTMIILVLSYCGRTMKVIRLIRSYRPISAIMFPLSTSCLMLVQKPRTTFGDGVRRVTYCPILNNLRVSSLIFESEVAA